MSLLMELPAVVHGLGEGLDRRINQVAVHEQVWVGIDVGKSSHHACVVDETGQVIFSQAVGNSQAPIEALIAKATVVGASARWALDMTSGTAALLIALLHEHGQQMSYVPGKLVNRMSGAFAGEGKTDAKDAKTIAETARLRSDLATITQSDKVIVELQVLTSRRDDLKADWVRGVNRLRALLARYFPALEAALDCSKRAPLILLTGFGTPSALRATAYDPDGDPQRVFGTPARLAAYAGLAPVPRDSGRVRGNLRRPKRYHRRLRRVFYMAAFVAITVDGPSQAFYRRKRAEGKRHAQALIALARRLVDLIWALLRDQREFSPSRAPATAAA